MDVFGKRLDNDEWKVIQVFNVLVLFVSLVHIVQNKKINSQLPCTIFRKFQFRLETH